MGVRTPNEVPNMPKLLYCYAENEGDGWEAICLDVDVAVQARTLHEVVLELSGALELYFETVMELPEAEHAQFFNRPAPWGIRLKFLWHALRGLIRGSSKERAEFTYHCPA